MAGMRGEMGMTRLLSRTSITVDEAVYILLGRSTGPIDVEPIGVAEDTEADGPAFCLQDILEDELDVLEGEYDLAKYENEPEDVIAEKLAALQDQETVIKQAYLYRCEINDELNKGEQSALKLDSALSNAVYSFITLHSFNAWRETISSEQLGGGDEIDLNPASQEGIDKKGPRKKQRDQEDAILEQIQKLGLDPLALPPDRSGRDGVKKDVRVALKSAPLFQGSTIFDKAWERLRKQDRIRKER